MEKHSPIKNMRRLPACLMILFMIQACSVPKHMRVRQGLHPDYQDKEVRFRTSYYFRVKKPQDTEGSTKKEIGPNLDSLYRFKMTGKAGALANDIVFEAGTLHKDLIDPFGAIAEYDRENRRFKLNENNTSKTNGEITKSAITTIKGLKQSLALKDGWNQENLNEIKASLNTITNSFNEDTTRINLVVDKINTLTETFPKKKENIDQATQSSIKKKFEGLLLLLKGLQKGEIAPTTRGGFQIWGHQGWSTFDQDSRLIMAMSSRAEPLISVLNEYSARVLKGGNMGKGTPLIQEYQRVSNANAILKKESSSDTAAKLLIDSIKSALKGDD